MRLASLFVLLGLLSACGSKVAADPQNAAPVALDQFCDRYADEACKVITPCCSKVGVSLNTATCRTAMLNTCHSHRDESVARGWVYDAKAGGICVAGLSGTVQGCASKPSTDPTTKLVIDSCENVFVPPVAVGGACTKSNDCAPKSGSTVSCSSGVCVATPLPRIGERCGDVGAHLCEDGAECDASGICRALPATGSACLSSGACAEGDWCDASNTCVPKKSNGTACSSSGECTGICTSGICTDETLTADACGAISSAGAASSPSK